jgi:hypothetical protein
MKEASEPGLLIVRGHQANYPLRFRLIRQEEGKNPWQGHGEAPFSGMA